MGGLQVPLRRHVGIQCLYVVEVVCRNMRVTQGHIGM